MMDEMTKYDYLVSEAKMLGHNSLWQDVSRSLEDMASAIEDLQTRYRKYPEQIEDEYLARLVSKLTSSQSADQAQLMREAATAISLLAPKTHLQISKHDDVLVAAMLASEEMHEQNKWFEHWRKLVPQWKTDHHSGDCTNEPWTCTRCVYDDAIKRLPGFKAIIENLPASGADDEVQKLRSENAILKAKIARIQSEFE